MDTLPIELLLIIVKFIKYKKISNRLLLINKSLHTKIRIHLLSVIDAFSVSEINDYHLSNLLFVKELDTYRNKKITDRGLKFLTNLKTLRLDHGLVTDKGLGNLCQLTSLNLESNYIITNNGFKNLTNLTKLILCTVNKNKIDDNGIRYLTNLTNLNLRFGDHFTGFGIELLTNLRTLDLTDANNIMDADIKKLTLLTYLNLRDNKSITDEGIKYLVNLLKLNLGGNRVITDFGIKFLTNLQGLVLINYGCNSVTKQGTSHLKILSH